MKEREIFQKLRGKKIKFGLRARLTVLVGCVIFISIMIALGIAALLAWVFPSKAVIPPFIQVNILSLIIATVSVGFLSKIFFDPIKKLREGMQKVADGDFTIQLDTKSSSAEIKEVLTGFNMMAQELQSTEILQSDFVSNVSHEFKTPINAIEGYATLLQNTENIDKIENEYIEKILFNTRRISSLVSNVLLLSKIENQSLQLHRETFDIAEQIREEIVASEPSWSSKNLDFDVEMEDTEYCGYRTLMHHVWSNLIGNAIKFSPDGGCIKMKLKQENDRLIFSVEDEGPGISEEAKKHIYDKFYQADASHKGDGNGLGLALVKRILGVCGGEISVENKGSQGCIFTVTLPQ